MKKSHAQSKPSRALPKKTNIPVGTFRLGNLDFALEALPDAEGGNYETRPLQLICVGFKHNDWQEVVGVLLHEAMEIAHTMARCKYRTVPISNYDSADCKFIFDHAEFGRACADVGCFMAEALPALAKVYKKYHK